MVETLSDKEQGFGYHQKLKYYKEEDVREAVKKVRELIDDCIDSSLDDKIIMKRFNEIFGEKLI